MQNQKTERASTRGEYRALFEKNRRGYSVLNRKLRRYHEFFLGPVPWGDPTRWLLRRVVLRSWVGTWWPKAADRLAALNWALLERRLDRKYRLQGEAPWPFPVRRRGSLGDIEDAMISSLFT